MSVALIRVSMTGTAQMVSIHTRASVVRALLDWTVALKSTSALQILANRANALTKSTHFLVTAMMVSRGLYVTQRLMNALPTLVTTATALTRSAALPAAVMMASLEMTAKRILTNVALILALMAFALTPSHRMNVYVTQDLQIHNAPQTLLNAAHTHACTENA